MNTNREFEKLTQDWLEDRVTAPSLDGLREVLDQTATTPQARARLLGRWFDRGGGARRGAADHDHPPHSDRRSRLMYSATAITAAIALTALAVNVIDTTPNQPSAHAVSTHVVAADGSADFSTIAEAVAAAAEGDTVLVRPGDYVEALVIDKDITLAGDGPRGEVLISIPEGGPTFDFAESGAVQQFAPAYSLLLDDTQADVSGLTFAGPEGEVAGHTGAIIVDGGSPMLSDLVLDGADFALLIGSGSTATLTDSLVSGGGIEAADHAEPLIARNDLRDGASIYGSMGDGTVIRDNTLTGGGGISVGGFMGDVPTDALIEGNTITGATGYAISTATTIDRAGAPVIRDNTISGSRNGIQVGAGPGPGVSVDDGPDAGDAKPLISGNDISAEMIAMSVNWSDARVVDNTIRDAWNGIVVFGGGSPEVMDNEVEVDGFGIDIGANTSPSVAGNSVCGATDSIKIHETATPSMGENTTCDDA